MITFYKLFNPPIISSFSVTTCSGDQFRCLDGICLSIDKRCNGIADCRNGEDENQCGKLIYFIPSLKRVLARSIFTSWERERDTSMRFPYQCRFRRSPTCYTPLFLLSSLIASSSLVDNVNPIIRCRMIITNARSIITFARATITLPQRFQQ